MKSAEQKQEYYNQKALWERNFLDIPEERERITRTIDFIPSDVQTILDVGCGNGAFLNALSTVYQAVGVDMSEEALKRVKTKAMFGDIAALPFESASFDLVTCLEVLEHLPVQVFEKALFQLQRVSRKYIIVSVPNGQELDYHLVICPVCRCWFNPNYHVRSFNPERLKDLFEQFSLVKVEEIGPLEPEPHYNQVLDAAYRRWRSAPPRYMAVCPQCGYSPPAVEPSVSNRKSASLLVYMLNLIKPLAKIIWRPQWRRRWLLALYAKGDMDRIDPA